jgi:hypothetical protein
MEGFCLQVADRLAYRRQSALAVTANCSGRREVQRLGAFDSETDCLSFLAHHCTSTAARARHVVSPLGCAGNSSLDAYRVGCRGQEAAGGSQRGLLGVVATHTWVPRSVS